MPRVLNPVGKIRFTVSVTETAAKSLSQIGISRGKDRATIAAEILEIAQQLDPQQFLQALAAFEKAAKHAG